ncbi:MAG TPA: pyridoxal-dependent decarboxylase, partial [Aquella sp.]|nr:pyridoxal-dependent decarboxylase [Aquella sp.]
FNLEDTNHFGYITYGGTEANLAGIWWHRKSLIKKHSEPVTLMCSKYSHYSLRKIADILQLDFVQIEANEYKINLSDLETKIRNVATPVIFVTNFGNTVYGAIDDIAQIHALFRKYKKDQFKIHGDGAIYGLLVPYMPEYKNISSIFDYIDTISFSGHKFLGCYSISGAILTRRDYLQKVFNEDNINIGYIQKAIDVTISGSRQGFYVAELYLLICEAFKYEKQQQKLEKLWLNCLALANWFYLQLVDLLISMGYEKQSVINNQLRLVIPAPSSKDKTDYLGQKYGLMPIGNTQLGIYVFPKVTKDHLENFLHDYRQNMSKLS